MTEASLPIPTVYVVDDDPDVRQSLESLIGALGHRVLTFCSAAQFRNYYQPHMPGCLLLDVHMPRQTGLELYEQLVREGKRLPVIFITAHADITTAVAAMKTGAIEFLEKPFHRDNLEGHLQKALTLDAEWRTRDAQFNEMGKRIASLTHREQETLQMILDGHPNKVMAARLDLTERAIEMRRARIMQKLECRSVAELINVAITHRVLSEIRELRANRELSR